MKMKKLISFLCAAALTVSSFAGLTVTASAAAADTVAITPTVGSKTVTVKNEGTTVTQGVLLHAVYANGALTSVESQDIPATSSVDAEVKYTKAAYEAYVDSSKTGSKFLAWNSLEGMEPITVTIVEPPAAKTAVNTVAELAVTATNNSKAPATITAAVTAKNGQTFTDTAAFTYAWTKDGVDANTTGATIENAAAGTYTVTATYNGTGDYEGSLGPATITITAADETRTNLSGATVALDKQTATVGDTVTATVKIGNENTNITDSADLTYQWYKAGETPTAVQGATAKTYTTTEAGTFYVTVSAAQASTTYIGTKNSGNVVVSEPVQAAPYVTSTDGKIKAISLYGGSYNEASQADKTYKQLKEGSIITPIETRNGIDSTGGETTYAEGVLLADNTTITDSKIASGEAITVVEVDIADVLDKTATHRISLKFDALTTFNGFNSEIYVSKLTAPTELATLTYTSLKELTTSGETNIGWGGRYTDATAMAKVITADVAAAAEANETKLYYAIYTKTRENALSNFALTAEQLYTVAVDSNITGGTVTTDKATAVAGETVTVTVAATSGHTYTEDSLSVKDASNNAVATTPVEGQAGKYTFTMPASNATVTAGFTENTGTPSTLKYIFTTDGTANGKVAEETVFEDSSDYMVEDAKTIAVTSDYIKPYKTGAKKIYGSATNGTFRVYKYVSGLDNAITVDAADKEVLVTVADLGHDYYDYQDFDHNAWGKFTKDNSSGLKAGAEFQGNVLWCRGGGSAWSYTDGIDDSVVLTYEQAFTYGKDKTNPTIIKNAAGEEIVSYIYHIGSANNNGYMQSVKIAGVEKITGTATGTDLVGASWFNSNSEATIGHVELTIDKNAKTATIVFKKGTETKLTLSGSIESLKDMKLASWANQGGMNSDNNVPAINDFGVYKYTAPTPAAKTITWANTLTGFTVKKGNSAIDSGATLAANDVITIEATAADKKVKSVTATGATFTVTDGVASATVGATPADIVITAVELEDKPTTPVASATVAAATLHDTRTTGAIADDALYTAHDVQVGEAANGVTPVTINTTNLKKHQNGDTPETMGYWTGVKFTLANVPATAKYYLSLTKPTGAIDYSSRGAITQILDDGTTNEISIYQDAEAYKEGGANAGKKVYFAVEGIDTVYEIDFATGVTLSNPTIAWIEGTQIKDIAVSLNDIPINSGAAIKAGDVIEISSSAPNTRVTDVFTYSGLHFTLTSDGGATYTVGENPQSISLEWVKTETAYGIISSSSNPQTITLTSTVGEGESARELSMVTNNENVTLAIGGVPEGKVIESIELSYPDSSTTIKNIPQENITKVEGATNTYKFQVPDDIEGQITVKVTVKTPFSVTLDSSKEGETVDIGDTLTANINPVDARNSVEFKWYRGTKDAGTNEITWAEIVGEENDSYTTGSDDYNKYIKVEVTAKSDTQYTGTKSAQTDSSIQTNLRAINTKLENCTIEMLENTATKEDSSTYYLAPKNNTVKFKVTPNTNLAVGTVTITKTSDADTKYELTSLGDNTYSFTMPNAEVDINATAVETSAEIPNKAEIVGPTSVKANGKAENQYDVKLYHDDKVTSYDANVVWSVYMGIAADAAQQPAEHSRFDGNKLIVDPNESSKKIQVRVAVSDKNESDPAFTTFYKYFEVTVVSQYIDQEFTFMRAPINNDENTVTTIENGYLMATAGTANNFSLASLSDFTFEDNLSESGVIKDGKVKLALDPNKKYTLKLYTDSTHTDDMLIYESATDAYGFDPTVSGTKEITVPAAVPAPGAEMLHGTALSPANAVAGDTVTITYPKSDDSYKVTDFRVAPNNDDNFFPDDFTTVEEDGVDYYTATFVVPAGGIQGVYPVQKTVRTINPQITAGSEGLGTVSVSTEKAVEGENITLTVTPNTGYKSYIQALRHGEIYNADITLTETEEGSGVYNFTMSDEDIDIKVTFSAREYNAYPLVADADAGYTGYLITEYLTEDATTRNGGVNDSYSVKYDSLVCYVVNPKDGYEITSVVFNGTTYTGTEAVEGVSEALPSYVAGEGYRFPAQVKGEMRPPVVTAAKKTYYIFDDTTEHGSISFTVDGGVPTTADVGGRQAYLAKAGQTIVATINPAEHYKFDKLQKMLGNGSAGVADITKDVNEGTYTFTMPNEAVTLAATFKAMTYTIGAVQSSDKYSGTLTVNGQTSGVGEEKTAEYNSIVRYTIKPRDNYEITKVVIGGTTYTENPNTEAKEEALPAYNSETGYAFYVTVTGDIASPEVTAVPYRHTINSNTPENGAITITVDGKETNKASANDTVKVAYTPANETTHIALTDLILTYGASSLPQESLGGSFFKKVDGEDAYTFKMPNETVTLSAIFGNPTHTLVLPEATYDASTGFSIAGGKYKIYIDNDVQTTYAAKTVGWGKVVQITDISPNTNYELASVTYTVDGVVNTITATPVENSADKYIFTMPNANATIAVNFAAAAVTTHTIAVPNKETDHGTVKVYAVTGNDEDGYTKSDEALSNLTAVPAGTMFVVEADPAEGYQLTSAGITVGSLTPAKKGNIENVYTMPAGDVTVSAEFEALYKTQAVTVTQTYADGTSTTNAPATSPVSYGAAKHSSGKIAYYNESWGSSLLLVKIDAMEAKDRIRTAKVSFKATPAKGSPKTRIAKLTDDSIDTSDLTALTFGDILGKTASLDFIEETATPSQFSYDFKDSLRVDGAATYVFFTDGNTINIADFAIDVQLEDEPIKAATATIHKVYADAEGAITVGENKYTEFGTASVINGLYQGDEYTVAETYKTTIDDNTQTARYEYVSGVGTVNLEKDSETGTNDIYIIYNKIDYEATTFSITLPNAAVAGGESMNIKLIGTPTPAGAAAVDTNVAVTVAEGETTGTATYKLLPGAYKYSFLQTDKYLGVEETNVTVGDINTMTLTANAKVATTVTVKYMTDVTDENTVVETKTVEDVFETDAFNLEADTYASTYLSAITKNNTDPANTFRRYTINSFSEGTYAIASLGAAEDNIIKVAVTTDNKDYYVWEDFNNYDLGATWTGVTTSTNCKVVAVDDTNIGTVKANNMSIGAQNGLSIGTNNKAMLWGSFNKATQEITRTMEGSGSVEVSFKMAVSSQSTKGRRIPVEFRDENGNVLITIYGEGSKNGSTQGIRYSVDGGKTYTALETSGTDASFHTYNIKFDMTNHKISLSFDGTTKVDKADMYTNNGEITLGSNVGDMHYIRTDAGVLAGLVFDDYAVNQYTAE